MTTFSHFSNSYLRMNSRVILSSFAYLLFSFIQKVGEKPSEEISPFHFAIYKHCSPDRHVADIYI